MSEKGSIDAIKQAAPIPDSDVPFFNTLFSRYESVHTSLEILTIEPRRSAASVTFTLTFKYQDRKSKLPATAQLRYAASLIQHGRAWTITELRHRP